MQRLFGLTALGLLLATLSVEAKRARQSTVPERVLLSDTIIVGNVQTIEDKPATVALPEGETEMSVALIRVAKPLLGAKGVTQMRVAFGPGGRGLTAEDAGCFFLVRVPGTEFYQPTPNCPLLLKDEAGFAQQIETIGKLTTILANPLPALQAKSAADRIAAAQTLIHKYRVARPVVVGLPMKEEDVPAAESKLILQTLAASDWEATDPLTQMVPRIAFSNLGLSDKDGFKPVGDYNTTARAWLKAHADTYRLKRWVVDPAKLK